MFTSAVRRGIVALLIVPFVQLPGSTPARADDIGQAKTRVTRLQGLLDQTTRSIAAGTREWEQDQARLHSLQARIAVLDAKMRKQQAVADTSQEHIDAVARRMYMQPVNDTIRLVVSMTPQEVVGLLQTQGELNHVAASNGDVIRKALAAKLDLSRTRHEVASLSSEANGLSARAAAKLAALNALADRTVRQLLDAQAALGRARAREAARIARLNAARAARLRALAGGVGAACLSSDTHAMSNGNLDPAVLCPLWMAPHHRLRTDAARAFNRMSQFHMAMLHKPICVTDSYRSYPQQVDVYRRKPELAAVPGTSQHGWGRAVDLCGGVQTYGTPAFRWMQQYGPRFGFHHPAWAEPSGSKPEAWHWEYGRS